MAKLDRSIWLTCIGILLLFSGAVIVTLIAPHHVDKSWTSPSSAYQVQMYTVSDPTTYISTIYSGADQVQLVYQVKQGGSLIAIKESELMRIVAPGPLERYINRYGAKELVLTNRLLLLKEPTIDNGAFDAAGKARQVRAQLQEQWKKEHPDGETVPRFTILELYDPGLEETFVIANTDGILEDWVDSGDFSIIEHGSSVPWDTSDGTIYVSNPRQYKVETYQVGRHRRWRYSPNGARVDTLANLQGLGLGFLSRRELITMGEAIYRKEGCWYCHTDQSRTLVSDCVLNGSEHYPAPPSSANEYIFQGVTMPGTRRIGPDLSRVAIKRPSRDWHLSHFWSPKTESPGTIMPRFQHFFDKDPRGSPDNPYGIPNYRFEAIFQYLMTKGSRITAPTEAWWTGKDPVNVLEIIDG